MSRITYHAPTGSPLIYFMTTRRTLALYTAYLWASGAITGATTTYLITRT